MKNFILFIGLGLLLSGCETNDPKTESKIYLKCVGKHFTTYDGIDPSSGTIRYLDRESPGARIYPAPVSETTLILDEGQKHISIQNVTEGTYTEKDNTIFAEHLHAPHGLDNDGSLIYLQLNKISGDLYITKYENDEEQEEKVKKPIKLVYKARPPLYQMSYQCESAEPVIR